MKKYYFISSGTFGDVSIAFKDREKLAKYLKKHNLSLNNNLIYIDNYQYPYSKKQLKRLFNRISKHLQRGFLKFSIADKFKNVCSEDKVYVIIVPNKVITIWDYLSDDICDFSYEYLSQKIFPYLDKETKQDLARYVLSKIMSLSDVLNKYELLINELLKER